MQLIPLQQSNLNKTENKRKNKDETSKLNSHSDGDCLLCAVTAKPSRQYTKHTGSGPLPISNTADGDLALAGVGLTGIYNSAFGFYALLSNGAASFNTGVGAGTLLVNTANEQTAVGAAALFSNTTGINNTGDGAFALFSNTTGLDNTAVGDRAMQSNIDGSRHTAVGSHALFNCIAPPVKRVRREHGRWRFSALQRHHRQPQYSHR